jgi:hypothetical protein
MQGKADRYDWTERIHPRYGEAGANFGLSPSRGFETDRLRWDRRSPPAPREYHDPCQAKLPPKGFDAAKEFMILRLNHLKVLCTTLVPSGVRDGESVCDRLV